MFPVMEIHADEGKHPARFEKAGNNRAGSPSVGFPVPGFDGQQRGSPLGLEYAPGFLAVWVSHYRHGLSVEDCGQHGFGGGIFTEKRDIAPNQNMDTIGFVAVFHPGNEKNAFGTGFLAGPAMGQAALFVKPAVVFREHHDLVAFSAEEPANVLKAPSAIVRPGGMDVTGCAYSHGTSMAFEKLVGDGANRIPPKDFPVIGAPIVPPIVPVNPNDLPKRGQP